MGVLNTKVFSNLLLSFYQKVLDIFIFDMYIAYVSPNCKCLCISIIADHNDMTPLKVYPKCFT